MIRLITQKSNGNSTQPDQADRIALDAPSVVTLGFGPEMVARFERSGDDLVLILTDGRRVLIEDFFVIRDSERNDVVFEDAAGVTWWGQYNEPWTGFHIAEIDTERLPPVFAFAGFPGALLALAGGGALIGGGGGGTPASNAPPVAVADTGSVSAAGIASDGVTPDPGQPEMQGNVLGNDSDPDRDPLVVTGFGIAGGAEVAPGTVLQGQFGTLVLNADGSYTYRIDNSLAATRELPAGSSGDEVFTYTISDGRGGTATATLTITVHGSNEAPAIDAATSDIAATITELTDGAPGENATTHSASGTLRFGDADLNDSHSASFVPLRDDGSYLGRLVLQAPDSATGTLVWRFEVEDSALDHLAAGEQLVQTYTVTLTDAQGARTTQTVTVTLTGSNDRPEPQPDAVLTLAGQPVALDVLANDRDIDNGDQARLHVVAIDNQPIAPGQTVQLSGGQGSVTLSGAGVLSFTPAPGFSGQLQLPYVVDDGSGAADAQASALWTINVITVDILDNASPADPNRGDDVLAAIDTLDAVAINGRAPVGGGITGLVISDGINSVTVDPATITLNPDGSFSTTADLRGLNDGTLTLTMTVTDPAGNAITATDTIRKDTVTAVTIDPVLLVEGEIPTITGRGEPGASISVTVGSDAPVTVIVQPDGSWSHTPATAPGPGPLVIGAAAQDAVGNTANTTREVAALTPEDTTPGQPGHLAVNESGLPGGSTAGDGSDNATASFQIDASGGDIRNIRIGGTLSGGTITGGTTITLDQLQALPGTPIPAIPTAYGLLTITGYDATTGTVTYSYALAGNTTDHANGTGIPSQNDSLQEAILLAVEDHDGDTRVTRIEAVVVDDVPAIVAGAGDPRLMHYESMIGITRTVVLADLFAVTPGADGATTTFRFEVDTNVASGLVDAANGAAVEFVLDADGLGITGIANGETVLRLTLDTDSGEVEFFLLRGVHHPDPTSRMEEIFFANGSLLVTATTRDADGDSASLSIAIGERFGIRDLGPRVEVTVDSTALPDLLTTDAAAVAGTAEVKADFAAVFQHGAEYYADGPAASGALVTSYALGLRGGLPSIGSDLRSGGALITLSMNPATGDVIGALGDGTIVFTVAVDADGEVTFERFLQVDQPVGSPGGIVTLVADLVQLTATSTVTDADGDSFTHSATVNIGASLHFGDDTPTTGPTPRAELDEAGLRSAASVEVRGVINADPGSDRHGSTPVRLTFADQQAAFEALGLRQGNEALTYSIEPLDKQVLTASANGATVFTVTLIQPSSTNNFESSYVFELRGPINHIDGSGPLTSIDLPFNFVLTDSDGDPAGNSFVVRVLDDVPQAVDQTGVSVVEGGALIGHDGIGWTSGTANLLDNDQRGVDGARVHEISYFNAAGDRTPGTIPANGSATFATFGGELTVYSDGRWSYVPKAAISHDNGADLADGFEYQLIDGDGDTSNWATQPIDVTDTAPVANDGTRTEAENVASFGGNVITDNDVESADIGAKIHSFDYTKDDGQPGAHDFVATGTDEISVDTPTGKLTVYSDGSWTLVTNTHHAHPGNASGASFTYRLVDTDGSLSNDATQTITITDLSPSVDNDVTLTLDEKDIPAIGSAGVAAGTPNTVEVGLNITKGPDPISDVRFDQATVDALNLLGLRSGTQPLSYQIYHQGGAAAEGHLLVATAGGQTVFTLQINNPGHSAGTNQSVTATLLRPLNHADGNGTNLLNIAVGYTVYDVDSSVPGSLTFSVIDDIPLAPRAGDQLEVREGDATAAIGVNLLDNDTLGADGGYVHSITYVNELGERIEHQPVTAAGLTVTTQYGTLSVAQNGVWSYLPNGEVHHDKTSNDLHLDHSFSYRIADNDGDISDYVAQSIRVLDTAPTLGRADDRTVSESSLPLGSAADTAALTVTGSLAVTPGQDLTNFATRLLLDPALLPVLTSRSEVVKYALAADGQTLVGYVGADPAAGALPPDGQRVFTLVLTAAGSGNPGYSYRLQRPLDHADPATDITFNFRFEVRDGDGDTAAGSFNVAVKDDRAEATLSNTFDEDGSWTFNTSADTTPANTTIWQNSAEVTGTPTGGTMVYELANGTVTVLADGRMTYQPAPHFSGREVFTFVTDDGTGETPTTVTANVTAVADAPTMGADAEIGTDEDTQILLGLKAPELVDIGGGRNNPDSERLGAISLGGLPVGATLLWPSSDGLSTLGHPITGTAPLRIILSDRDHVSGVTGDITMTAAQFEALSVRPPEHDHQRFTVTVTATSHEVEPGTHNPKSGVSAPATQVVVVHVKAVTDPVTLAYDRSVTSTDGALVTHAADPAEQRVTVTLQEDNSFLLNPLLDAQYRDLDGSEHRWITISNPTGNSTIRVSYNNRDYDIAAGRAESFADFAGSAGQTGTISGFPEIRISALGDFSGAINNIEIQLHARDQDSDGHLGNTTNQSAGLESSDTLTLDMTVTARAGDVGVAAARGPEDTEIAFLAGVAVTDIDTGNEFITSISFTAPDGWAVRVPDANIVPGADWSHSVSGTTHTITFTTENRALHELVLDAFGITPPAHDSTDARIQLSITTKDISATNNPLHDHEATVPRELHITVTPVAEQIPDIPTSGDSLAMNGDHVYTTQGEEDEWFTLGIDGGFNLQTGWRNDDTGELTYAALTPRMLNLAGGSSPAIGAQFQWIEVVGTNPPVTRTATFNGDPVLVPMESLATLKFMAPADVAGRFEIAVQAHTVDYDDDDTDHTGEPSTATSGGAVLSNLLILPVVDAVALSVGGSARGIEDQPIRLAIRPSSSDPSETQTITISGIPANAVIHYDHDLQTLVAEPDGTYSLTIPNFQSNLPLTITPPPQSNEDFTLTVTAVSVDTVTVLNDDGTTTTTYTDTTDPADAKSLDIRVGVRGVADPVDLILPDAQPTYSEAALDAGGRIPLRELLHEVNGITKIDTDGSETLTLRISGLPEGFAPLGGATLLTPEATGVDRVWLLTEAQFENTTVIRVPENFSGTVNFSVVAVTTENDGSSLTGDPTTLSFTVTPSTESTVTQSAELIEDQPTLLGLSIVHGRDADERLHSIRIAFDQVDHAAGPTGAGFSLRLGESGMTLADALALPILGISQVNEGGVDYYQLSGDLAAQLSAVGNLHSDGALGSFDFLYQIIDDRFGTAPALDANDAPLVGLSGYQPGTFTLTAQPVTDPPGAEIRAITSTITDADISDATAGDNASPDRVLVTSGGDVTVNLTVTSPDQDGSEHIVRVLITGVPRGVSVQGAELIGTDSWLLVYDGSNGNFAKPLAGGEYTIPVVFEISGNAQAAGGADITMTAQVQDRGNDPAATTRIETASVSWQLVTQFGPGGGTDDPLRITAWEYKNTPVTEDGWFKLYDVIDAGVRIGTSGADNIVTIRIEDLPVGTEVRGMTMTMIGGQPVWTATITGGDDIVDKLALLMNRIEIRPPANSNDNNNDPDGFHIKATLNAAVADGAGIAEASVGGGVDGPQVIPVTPVTDQASFTITPVVGPEGVTEAHEAVPLRITVSAPADGTSGRVIGGKLYLLINATDASGDVIPDGSVFVGGVAIIPSPVTGIPDLDDGNYYVFDDVEMGVPFDFEFRHTDLEPGNINVSAWVQNQEFGAATPLTSATPGAVQIPVNITNDGVTVTSDPSTGSEVGTLSGLTLLQGLGVTLNDGDELIHSILLSNLPDGFLIFTGDDPDDLSLAAMASNAGGTNGTNTWILAENGVALPAYVAILPPPYWSGTLGSADPADTTGLRLIVSSGESTLEPRTDSVPLAPVTIAPVADGVLLEASHAFGTEGNIIPLNLNVALIDDQDATVRHGGTDVARDANTETATLQLTGLGAHAAFYVNGTLLPYLATAYDAATDTYTLAGLSQEQLDGLGLRQARSAIGDADPALAGQQVTIKAWSVDGGATSPVAQGTITLSLQAQLTTTGDNTLIWTGQPINARAGVDTVQLRYGESLTGAALAGTTAARVLQNVEILDLGIGGSNAITDLTPEQVRLITDSHQALRITGTTEDSVTLTGNWAPGIPDGVGNTVYTGTIDLGGGHSTSVTLTVATSGGPTVVLPVAPAAGGMAGFSLFADEDAVFGLAALGEEEAAPADDPASRDSDPAAVPGLDALFSDPAPDDLGALLPGSDDPQEPPLPPTGDGGADAGPTMVEPPQPSIWDEDLLDLDSI